MKKIFLALLCILALSSCKDLKKKVKMSSSNAQYYIVVVANPDNWKGSVGDTLRSILAEDYPMLNQIEPRYDLVHVTGNNFSGQNQLFPNILVVSTGENYPEAKLEATYDLYAEPQIVVQAVGPDEKSLTQYLSDHRFELVRIFDMAERNRFITRIKKVSDQSVEDSIEKKFKIKMTIPKGYKIRKSEPDFMWISNEMPIVSQGFMIYSYPYQGKYMLSLDSLIAKRNELLKKYIEGPSKGSYMTTVSLFEPEYSTETINNREWVEIRGFWDVEGDAMGGPFVSYTTLHNGKVYTIDEYLFSPSKPKRNYVKQLETLLYTVEFK